MTCTACVAKTAGTGTSHGTICKCGLAKSYHPRLAADHEYEPRYLALPVEPTLDEAARTVLEAVRPRPLGPGMWHTPSLIHNSPAINVLRAALRSEGEDNR